VLRNANVLPPELEVRKQLAALDAEITETRDESELRELRRRRSLTDLNYRVMMERHVRAARPR
jgi:hypothetical protein